MRKLVIAVLLAASPQVVSSQEACTYDRCALRVEMRNIVAGSQGIEKYPLRLFSTPRLEDRLAISDSALAHYRVFTSNHVSANVWNLVGGSLLAFGMVDSISDADVMSTEVGIGVTVVGVIASLIGNNKTRKAQNGLARAIWWYNRELPR